MLRLRPEDRTVILTAPLSKTPKRLCKKKKTGLVCPVSHGVALDAVTSQHGATDAEAARWLG